MRSLRSCGLALLGAALLAGPAGAQDRMPTELWSEYPVVQKVQRVRAQPTTIGPLLPPSPGETTTADGESPAWSLWLAVAAAGALAVFLAARTAAPVASSGIRAVGGGARRLQRLTRPTPRTRGQKPARPAHPHAPARRRQPQYAPLPPVSVAEPDIEREPRHYVTRRTGFLRSRFVVVADEPGGKVTRLRSSKSFWRVGGAARREEAADEAWNDLVNDLRVSGWEPYTAQPSDFYVLLRRVDSQPTSALSTIEAYTHSDTG
jgi:hypothetical protein